MYSITPQQSQCCKCGRYETKVKGRFCLTPQQSSCCECGRHETKAKGTFGLTPQQSSCCECGRHEAKVKGKFGLTPQQSSCCECSRQETKVKGKFGLAWVMETPDCKREPSGWQVEFFDTPNRVLQKCQDMIEWVNTPPVLCSCSLKEAEDYPNDSYNCSPDSSVNTCSACGRCCNCGPTPSTHAYNPAPPCSCNYGQHNRNDKNFEEAPVKEQPKVVNKATSAVEMKKPERSPPESQRLIPDNLSNKNPANMTKEENPTNVANGEGPANVTNSENLENASNSSAPEDNQDKPRRRSFRRRR